MRRPASTTASAQNPTRRMWALAALLATGSAALVISLNAWAGGSGHGGHGGPGMDGMHMAAGMGMGGHHGKHGFALGGRHLERMLDKVDATPAQREQIRPLMAKAGADLKAMHEEARALHEQGLKLWAQPQIDAAAAERLRQQMLAQHDKVSKRMLQATLDVGQVLTPAQRAKMAERMQERMRKHQERHERMHERMQRHHERHGGAHAGASAPMSPSAAQQPAAKE